MKRWNEEAAAADRGGDITECQSLQGLLGKPGLRANSMELKPAFDAWLNEFVMKEQPFHGGVAFALVARHPTE